MNKDTAKLVSIDDLDLTASSDIAYDLEIENAKGVKTGIVIRVIGSQSESIKQLINDHHNRQERKKKLEEKRGNKEYFETAEEIDEYSNKLLAARIVGWSGIAEEYSPANAQNLMRKNSFIAAQVVEASNDVGNFNKS